MSWCRSVSVHRPSGRQLASVLTLSLAGLAISALPASASAATTGHYGVTIVAPSQMPPSGVPFDITGHVSPGASGATVHLQRYVGGHFTTVAAARLDGSSSYRFTQSYKDVGGYTFRVVKPAHAGIQQGISPMRRVFVTGDTIKSGPIIKVGNGLISSDGTYRLTMQSDGNLAMSLTVTGRVIWSMGTSGHPGAWAVLQRDGNLVVHAAGGAVLRTTKSGGHPSGTYSMQLQTDSQLVISTPNGTPIWTSDTVNDTLYATEYLRPYQSIRSADEHYRLLMQAGGNLVLYDTTTRRATWDSGTGVPGSTAVMRSDGNLTIHGPLGKLIWSTRTYGYPGAKTTLQTDDNLVVSLHGVALWSSKGLGGVLGDDYPPRLRNATKDSIIDPWRFYNRECVSFVAWRMNSADHVDFTNFMGGGRWGNANNWDNNARALGYLVNDVPARGAIAQSDSQSAQGHVAWVASVGDGTVTIEDYNFSSPGNYGTRTVPTSTYQYIHIKDLMDVK